MNIFTKESITEDLGLVALGFEIHEETEHERLGRLLKRDTGAGRLAICNGVEISLVKERLDGSGLLRLAIIDYRTLAVKSWTNEDYDPQAVVNQLVEFIPELLPLIRKERIRKLL